VIVRRTTSTYKLHEVYACIHTRTSSPIMLLIPIAWSKYSWYLHTKYIFFSSFFRAFILYEVMKIYLLPRDQREVTRKKRRWWRRGKENSGMEYSLTIDYPVSLSHRDYCFHSSCSSYVHLNSFSWKYNC
jgi:hypothetical protein